MSKLFKAYMRATKAETGYRCNWYPTQNLEVGDIGVIEKGQFIRHSSLKNLGITCNVIDGGEAEFDFTSEGNVKVHTKASGDMPVLQNSMLGKADAGVTVEFTGDYAIVFEMRKARSYKIDDAIALRDAMMKRKERGQWERRWVVVTEVIKAEDGVIMISKSNGSVVDFKANGELGNEKVKLTDLNLEIVKESQRGKVLSFVPKSQFTPLFSVMGFNIWNKLVKAGDDASDSPKEEFPGELPVSDDEIDAILDY